MTDDSFPIKPEIPKELFDRCLEDNDFMPILFEWYKYTGSICSFLSCISPESPAVREIPKKHYSILIGLLNRCSRLMLANVALTHEGKFGETSSILDRCIAESTIKVRWLCSQNNDTCFKQFMAEDLRTEIELKEKIEENIQKNNDESRAIETRMLSSINNLIEESELSVSEIKRTKRMPNFANILKDLQLNRITYIALQRIGSHHVHGTWPSLMFHYLEENENGTYCPRDHDCKPHENQFIFLPLLVIESIRDFINFIMKEEREVEVLFELLDDTKEEILAINQYLTDEDLKY